MSYQNRNQTTANYEIATRGRPSCFVYFGFAIMLTALNPSLLDPWWVAGFFDLLLLGLGALRLANIRAIIAKEGQVEPSVRTTFSVLCLANAFTWGLFAAWSVPHCKEWQLLMTLVLNAAISAGALSSLAPDGPLFTRFGLLLNTPTLIALLLSTHEGTSAHAGMVFGLLSFLLWYGHIQSVNYRAQLERDTLQLEELASARERLEMVMEASDLGIFDWYPDEGRAHIDGIWSWLGYNPEGRSLDQMLSLAHPADLLAARELVVTHLKNEQGPGEIDIRITAASGRETVLRFRGRVVRRELDGRAVRLAGTYLDITRQTQARKAVEEWEARVQQAEKLNTLGMLAGGVAHDFNNLLAAFVGNLELAELDLPADCQARANLIEAKQSALEASQLCDQMLMYAGKNTINPEEFCLNDLIVRMGQLLRVSLSKGVTLELDLQPELPGLSGDPTQIRQVVLNLITNASEAMAEGGGEIQVLTRQLDAAGASRVLGHPRVGPHLCLIVKDSGCGMAPETIARIFDPFFTTKFTGRGLGLAAVLGIIKAHGGEVLVESSPGRGTTFQVVLPASAQAPQPATTLQDQSQEAGSRLVLVVDDEAPIRRICRRLLQKSGHQVLEASDGVEALQRLAEEPAIELVVLDLTMPRKDGVQTLLELRQSWPHLPVILASGYSEQSLETDVSRLAQGFLKKPFSLDDLLFQLEKALEASRCKQPA
ncbi:MAG: ATP-binding protein [Vulcanimicrobiota bacterium]